MLPTPGTLKMPSVTVAPTSSTPKFVAELVMTGMSELRSTCTGTTRERVSPLLYAVRTQSWLSVSMTDDRMRRMLVA